MIDGVTSQGLTPDCRNAGRAAEKPTIQSLTFTPSHIFLLPRGVQSLRVFVNILDALLVSLIRATCHAHLYLVDLTTLTFPVASLMLPVGGSGGLLLLLLLVLLLLLLLLLGGA